MAGIIVHEWLEAHGGAEQVLEQMALTFPDAPIQALWNDVPDRFSPARVRETWLARTSLRKSKSLAVPLMPSVWRNLGTAEADWLLCSSHLFGHHARFQGAARDAPKFVYAHTPARYIWTPELDARGNSVLVRAASVGLRALDRARAQEAFAIAANSSFVRDRIAQCWDRDAVVIYPPVNVGAFSGGPATDLMTPQELEIVANLPPEYILGASRFVPYKRLEDVITAGNAAGVPVVLAGAGPSREKLEAFASNSRVPVTFLDRPSHLLLVELFRNAIAYIFPPIEDFGIMPVEAMAVGTPVIANVKGGAAESVLDGVTGTLVEDFSGAAIRDAISAAEGMDRNRCRSRAMEFDESIFREKVRNWVTEGIAETRGEVLEDRKDSITN
ncbi:glycosyltransferase [Arthrobacter sp. zg-Y826]|uniref:glycosyltransferase n=1 Tax=Arthrobacter jinronghuae TaxID=2964609 RepID=UPI0021080A5C|nr:glycosyltransferase [Arthrobacter jinronghuae]MCQ1957267.1 glycosyltransferase [Arthrobacter jinronghuae]